MEITKEQIKMAIIVAFEEEIENVYYLHELAFTAIVIPFEDYYINIHTGEFYPVLTWDRDGCLTDDPRLGTYYIHSMGKLQYQSAKEEEAILQKAREVYQEQMQMKALEEERKIISYQKKKFERERGGF